MIARSLCHAWLQAKQKERIAKDERRQIEDQLLLLNVTQIDEFQINLTPRIDYKVNADLLEQLALENGLTEHIANLFRWRPELNLKAWEAAHKDITEPLRPAITATEGRASFQITVKKQDEKENN